MCFLWKKRKLLTYHQKDLRVRLVVRVSQAENHRSNIILFYRTQWITNILWWVMFWEFTFAKSKFASLLIKELLSRKSTMYILFFSQTCSSNITILCVSRLKLYRNKVIKMSYVLVPELLLLLLLLLFCSFINYSLETAICLLFQWAQRHLRILLRHRTDLAMPRSPCPLTRYLLLLQIVEIAKNQFLLHGLQNQRHPH